MNGLRVVRKIVGEPVPVEGLRPAQNSWVEMVLRMDENNNRYYVQVRRCDRWGVERQNDPWVFFDGTEESCLNFVSEFHRNS